MADKYSTIQQHQPLRVPESFGSQGKMFVVQLDEIFDDIYRRFGRIRLEDLSEKLKMVVQDKYGRVNGIYVTEDGIDIEANAGDDMHIRLVSGTSVVLIDPSQINMNTEGLVSILGKGNSVIRLVGGGTDDQTIFQADATGVVQAKSVESEEIESDSMTVRDLTVTGDLIADIDIPNVVVSKTKPAAGNSTIWIEPATGTTTEPYTRSKTATDATVSAWSSQGNYVWTQTCGITDINIQGAKKIKVAGQLYKNASTSNISLKLEIRYNYSSGNSGWIEVGTFPKLQSLKWDYSFSKTTNVSISSNIELQTVSYRLTCMEGNEASAAYSYPHDVKVTVTGETGSSGTSDECTVHYIP